MQAFPLKRTVEQVYIFKVCQAFFLLQGISQKKKIKLKAQKVIFRAGPLKLYKWPIYKYHGLHRLSCQSCVNISTNCMCSLNISERKLLWLFLIETVVISTANKKYLPWVATTCLNHCLEMFTNRLKIGWVLSRNPSRVLDCW